MSNNNFPLSALPEQVRAFAQSAALSIGCDSAFVAVPMLVTAAAAVGSSSDLLVKQGWSEPSILWAGIVAPSGSGKSPALELATQPLTALHVSAALEHRNNPQGKQRRYVTSDCTLESLAMMLGENPQGLLLSRDELSGWLGAFDRYHSGKGADAAGWLSLHSGVSTIVDRKKSESVCVPKPRLSLVGTIQPTVLEKCIASHLGNGMAARLLLCQPSIQPRQWTDEELSSEQSERWKIVIDKLVTLRDYEPVKYQLSAAARARFAEWFDSHNAETVQLTEAMRSLWSKLEAACARISLVLHLLDWACGDDPLPSEYVTKACIGRAIQVVEYFKAESKTIYKAWEVSPMARVLQMTLDRVMRMGGSCTEREYSRKHSITAEEACSSLHRLVVEGLAEWQTIPAGPNGGRSTRRLNLSTDTTDET